MNNIENPLVPTVSKYDHLFAAYVKAFTKMPQKIKHYHRQRTWSFKKPKIAVYTAIVDNSDTLKLPQILSSDIDYICFSNTPLQNAGVWQIRACPWLDTDAVKTAHYVKTHPHYLLDGYDIAVWVDSDLLICGDLMHYVQNFMQSYKSVGAVPHPQSNNIYEEAESCIKQSKDKTEVIQKQIECYKQQGFEHNDLIESNFMLFRLGSPGLDKFLNEWWTEIEKYSRRDQLSLNYCLHKNGIEWYQLFPKGICCRNNPDILQLDSENNVQDYNALFDTLPAKIENPYQDKPYAKVRRRHFRKVSDKQIDVVVCVHNALEYVQKCVETLIKWHRSDNEHIIIIDDGSDAPTADFLKQAAAENKFIRVIRHEQAQGYTKSANEGFWSGNGDLVILLNSDTEVTKNWSLKMADTVFSVKGAGIVGPMSNAATGQSLPNIKGKDGQTAINILPPKITPDYMNKLCEQLTDSGINLRVPVIHGFCFGVTRECLNKLKGFDEKHFPVGFGEENDFCMRAGKAGFSMVVATHTFVYHAKTKSFNTARRLELCQAGTQQLYDLHGKELLYHATDCLRKNQVLIRMRNAVKTLFDAYNFKSQDMAFKMPRQKIRFNSKSVIDFKKIGRGFASDAVNTLPFRQSAITSYISAWGKKIRIASWFDVYGRVMVAINKGGVWKITPTQFYHNVNDAHNCLSIAVDGSGYIHLAWCLHGRKLYYARSIEPLVPQFELLSLAENTANFITYPEFYVQPSGDVLLLYRHGKSGAGNLVLQRYMHRSKQWILLSNSLIDGCQKESAYWQAYVDDKGRLHLSWCWRKTCDVASNHDICYMCSTDAECTKFADINGRIKQIPQTPDNSEPIYNIAQNSGLINQTSMTVDENNVPYIVTYFNLDNVLQYAVLYFENGKWKILNTKIRKSSSILEGKGTQCLPCARPQILAYNNKILLLLRDEEYNNRLMLAKSNLKADNFEFVLKELTENSLGEYEPMYDRVLWQKNRQLSLFVQYAYYKADGNSLVDVCAENVYIVDVKI